jgi:hypothetical protein
VISLFAPKGKSRRRSLNPPFFGVSSPLVEPGVLERVRGGEPKDAKKVPVFPSPSVATEEFAKAAETGFGAAGALTVVIMETLGSMSSADKNEVLSKSSRVEVILRN